MREIEFRAISTVYNKFVYGCYFRSFGCKNGVKQYVDFIYSTEEDLYHPININTLNQYTGLKDKNGVKIFEGDIVKLPSYLTYNTEYAICKWLDNRFSVEDVIGFGFVDLKEKRVKSDEWEDFEVIGNIYKNKELLENV